MNFVSQKASFCTSTACHTAWTHTGTGANFLSRAAAVWQASQAHAGQQSQLSGAPSTVSKQALKPGLGKASH